MQQWYVLHTKPHKERQVASALRFQKLEVFLPIVRVNPVNPRAARERAYFPNYLFAHLDLSVTGLDVVQWTPGLRSLVLIGDQPAAVHDSLIIELKRRLSEIRAAGGLVFDGLKPGERIRIVNGPFAGYEGVFDVRLSGTERVRVLLELIGDRRRGWDKPRAIPIELNAGDIAKVRSR